MTLLKAVLLALAAATATAAHAAECPRKDALGTSPRDDCRSAGVSPASA